MHATIRYGMDICKTVEGVIAPRMGGARRYLVFRGRGCCNRLARLRPVSIRHSANFSRRTKARNDPHRCFASLFHDSNHLL